MITAPDPDCLSFMESNPRSVETGFKMPNRNWNRFEPDPSSPFDPNCKQECITEHLSKTPADGIDFNLSFF